MSAVGRWCAIGAVILAAVAVATWDRGQDAASARATAPRLDGRNVFLAKGCASCHISPDTKPLIADWFPPLDQAPEWAGSRLPGKTAEHYLAESMLAPQAFISPVFQGGDPGGKMPTLRLSDDEITALVDYLLHRSP